MLRYRLFMGITTLSIGSACSKNQNMLLQNQIHRQHALVKRLRSKNSLSAIAIYLGILLFYIGFSI
ncbi:hypothetical protein ACOBV9_20840 (plasmid) [Pseudoalteromonas espejiana]